MSALLQMKESGGKLEQTRSELKTLFEKKDESGKLDWKKEDHESFETLEKKATAEHEEFKKWERIYKVEEKNSAELDYLKKADGTNPYLGNDGGSLGDRQRQQKSIGEIFVESSAFKNYLKNAKNGDCSVELKECDMVALKYGQGFSPQFKTTMTTAAGFPPFVTRTGDVVPFPFRKPVIADLMPEIPTGENAIKYMEETTHTSNAAGTLEATALPESAVQYTEKTVSIEDIGTSLPLSERMLDDAPYIINYINASVGMEVARAEESQQVGGNASSPNLYGFLSTQAQTDGMQTLAMGGDNAITAFMKAMVLVQTVGFAVPSAGVFHPINWQNIVTLQDKTGRYIFGDPSQTGPTTLWGVPIIATVAMTQNTALVGDFALYAYIARRRGVVMEMGWVNDGFTKRVRTLRAYGRMAQVIRRKSAFCTVTGLP